MTNRPGCQCGEGVRCDATGCDLVEMGKPYDPDKHCRYCWKYWHREEDNRRDGGDGKVHRVLGVYKNPKRPPCLCDGRTDIRCDDEHCDIASPEGAPGDSNRCTVCWKWHHSGPHRVAWGGTPKPGTDPATPPPSRAASKYLKRLGTPCVHLGPETGEKHDCDLCGGAKQVPLRSCAVFGKCTNERKLRYRDKANGAWVEVPFCLSCERYEIPDPFGGKEPVRNLLYHVMPVAGNGIWQRNVCALVRRLPLFNGKKVVAIVTSGSAPTPYGGPSKPDAARTQLALDDPRHVRALLAGHGCEFVEVPNDPMLREVATFEALFSRVESTDPLQVTLYAHAKGVTRARDSHLHEWADMLYETMLDYWPLVWRTLREYPVCGSFLRHNRGWPESSSTWHFSGSWFWFRSAALFSKPDWRRIDRFWSGIEPYPSLHFQAHEAGLLFHEFRGDGPAMYDPNYVKNAVAPALEQWRREHAADRKEW